LSTQAILYPGGHGGMVQSQLSLGLGDGEFDGLGEFDGDELDGDELDGDELDGDELDGEELLGELLDGLLLDGEELDGDELDSWQQSPKGSGS